LHFALNPSGYLILGTSETIDGAGNLFVVEDKDHHIFRSRPVAPRAFPIPEVPFRPTFRPLNEKESSPEESRAGKRLSFAELHQRLLEQYGPPSVIVNENYDIVHLTKRAGRYLELGGGEPSHNLLKIVRPELRLELRMALYQAVHDRTNIEVPGLKVDTTDGTQIVNIIVRPVLREEDAARGFLLVLFEETKGDEVRESVSLADEPISHWLEEELVRSKAQLRGTVEQYEVKQEELRASNEELQAMNEELRSTAEELETSKEELQSVNEELSTVNQELKIKIEELSQANNNFQNLMNSTNVGTIFLDQNLKVTQFTPSAQETFNLIATDIGRPLLDITTRLKDVNLLSDLESVLKTLHIVERQVRTVDQKTFVMRIAPYRTLQNKIEGLVLTLVDITELTQVRTDLLEASHALVSRNKEHTRDLEVANEALRDEVKVRKRGEEARIQLLGQLVSAQEDERHRFARDLHDQLGQQLTALKMKLESLKIQAANRVQLSGAIDDLQGIVKQLDLDVEFLAWQLRPLALDDLGLPAALSNYVKQWSEHFGIPAEFHSGELSRRFKPKIETNLYRIAQEALNNCAKHSNCSRADVLLECRGENLVLIVEDDGIGFNPPAGHEGDRHWGLIGMRERSALLEGTIEIESTRGAGTTIYVRVPLMGDGGGRE
jgi:two-component system CheB/CheR fusion protein